MAANCRVRNFSDLRRIEWREHVGIISIIWKDSRFETLIPRSNLHALRAIMGGF